ncbi:MORC family CW-type zinc finger protein 3-like isoform X1 [Conger conger]|uniref:MORC family CW-type zinc finger protein 3-like isoform X1 n=1 Tax=Conger conger TaxID=82655 RepID=UPI002A5A6B2D|nr:MORC family CW-type zinc finger protein 3-like isoform X1 [Conger conger]
MYIPGLLLHPGNHISCDTTAATPSALRKTSLNPQYLQANSTSHTWPFGAFAELIDNAYDPDVNAKQQWIDSTQIRTMDCLIFSDNGAGLDYNNMLKMMSFGYSNKKPINGHAPVGQYGNGFKSGSMRLGKDAIVFSKTRDTMSVGLLSQTYLKAIQAQHIVVPIISCKQNGEEKFSDVPDHSDSLEAILKHSLFGTEDELLQELQAINTTNSSTGTRIIIWNLRRFTGETEFDFEKDRYDIQIRRVDLGDDNNHQDPNKVSEPESQYSLRAYCSILYLKPRMQIIIRGQKVRTQLVSKSLALTRKDRYTPQFLKKNINITFGYNTRNKENCGVMMYYKNRLIRAYERVGCQRKATPKAMGVIGIIECDFLTPTHNKQDFDATEEYRKVKQKLGEKLEEYWCEIRYIKSKKDPSCDLAIEDTEKSPDQNWVQCDKCHKWRKLPDEIDMSKLGDVWFCHLNSDPQYRICQAEEQLEDSEDEQPYQKTYKQDKKQQQEKNRWQTMTQQNAEEAIPAQSTSTPPSTRSSRSQCSSGTRAEGDFTDRTSPTLTPVSRSGRRLSAQQTPLSTRSKRTTMRGKRVLLTPESEQVKRAKMSQSTSSAADMEAVPQDTPDVPLLVEEMGEPVSPCDLDRASNEHTNLQVSDGAPAQEYMHSHDLTVSITALSPVPQQVTAASQTEGVAEIKQELEEERTRSWREDETSEQTQLQKRETRELTDSGEGVRPSQEMQQDWLFKQWEIVCKERDLYLEQWETASKEGDCYKDQVEIANQDRDQYKEQMETANQERDRYRDREETANQETDRYRDQVKKANQERDQYKVQMETAKDQCKEQMETANQERDQYKRQMETVKDQYKEQMETANQERDQYKRQMETVKDQYKEQIETANQERDQYKRQMETAKDLYKEQMETANQGGDQYKKQMETANQERDQYKMQMETVKDQYKEQMETANQERDQYKLQVDKLNQKLQQMRASSEPCDQVPGGEDHLARQLEFIHRDLDLSNVERDQLRSQLQNLRLSVSRLLVILIPVLDLEQVNYESCIIEEILEQYLDGISSSQPTFL